METLLRKRKTISPKNHLQENFSKEIDLDEVVYYIKDHTSNGSITSPLSLKDDWMEFIDITMTMMHSKISL